MKKFIALFLVLVTFGVVMTGCIGTGSSEDSKEKESSFHNKVEETQELLDEYADDIYRCWYDYIYNKKYSSVDSAILAAMLENSSNIDQIEANNEEITELYKEVRDGSLSAELKSVMQAYNEYYSFVMEVSGSFNSYSASKETLKKALSSALKNLSMEL